MSSSDLASRVEITMVGTLPPMSAGQSPYCGRLAEELARKLRVQFIAFRSIYPHFMYPVGNTREDSPTVLPPQHPNLSIHHLLSWWNPTSWVRAGLHSEGDIVHIQWWTTILFPILFTLAIILRYRGKTIVATAHNIVGHETGRWDRLASRIFFRIPHHFIVHTEENKRQLAEIFGIQGTHVSVVPIGAYDMYQDEALSPTEARRRLGLETEERVILCFGHIRGYKGIDVLIEAFAKLQNRMPGTRLVIAGKNWVDWQPYQDLIQRHQLESSVTVCLDYVLSSKVQEYFMAADVVVLPYLDFAAQSGPGNIALAFGKPLVVTNVGGLPDLVKDRSQVVPSGDAEALAQALTELLSNEARLDQARRDSLALAQENSWNRVAEQTIELYRSLQGRT